MNTDTGEIRRFESTKAAMEAGFRMSLTDEEARMLIPMSMDERIKWAKERQDPTLTEKPLRSTRRRFKSRQRQSR